MMGKVVGIAPKNNAQVYDHNGLSSRSDYDAHE